MAHRGRCSIYFGQEKKKIQEGLKEVEEEWKLVKAIRKRAFKNFSDMSWKDREMGNHWENSGKIDEREANISNRLIKCHRTRTAFELTENSKDPTWWKMMITSNQRDTEWMNKSKYCSYPHYAHINIRDEIPQAMFPLTHPSTHNP